MTGRFDGKTAIITGGAKGIGRATAVRFLREGGRLAVLDQEAEESDWVQGLRREVGGGDNRLAGRPGHECRGFRRRLDAHGPVVVILHQNTLGTAPFEGVYITQRPRQHRIKSRRLRVARQGW